MKQHQLRAPYTANHVTDKIGIVYTRTELLGIVAGLIHVHQQNCRYIKCYQVITLINEYSVT